MMMSKYAVRRIIAMTKNLIYYTSRNLHERDVLVRKSKMPAYWLGEIPSNLSFIEYDRFTDKSGWQYIVYEIQGLQPLRRLKDFHVNLSQNQLLRILKEILRPPNIEHFMTMRFKFGYSELWLDKDNHLFIQPNTAGPIQYESQFQIEKMNVHEIGKLLYFLMKGKQPLYRQQFQSDLQASKYRLSNIISMMLLPDQRISFQQLIRQVDDLQSKIVQQHQITRRISFQNRRVYRGYLKQWSNKNQISNFKAKRFPSKSEIQYQKTQNLLRRLSFCTPKNIKKTDRYQTPDTSTALIKSGTKNRSAFFTRKSSISRQKTKQLQQLMNGGYIKAKHKQINQKVSQEEKSIEQERALKSIQQKRVEQIQIQWNIEKQKQQRKYKQERYEKQMRERNEQKRAEQKRLEQKRAEQSRVQRERERIERERIDRERIERERIDRERIERERIERERKRIEHERLEHEQKTKQKQIQKQISDLLQKEKKKKIAKEKQVKKDIKKDYQDQSIQQQFLDDKKVINTALQQPLMKPEKESTFIKTVQQYSDLKAQLPKKVQPDKPVSRRNETGNYRRRVLEIQINNSLDYQPKKRYHIEEDIQVKEINKNFARSKESERIHGILMTHVDRLNELFSHLKRNISIQAKHLFQSIQFQSLPMNYFTLTYFYKHRQMLVKLCESYIICYHLKVATGLSHSDLELWLNTSDYKNQLRDSVMKDQQKHKIHLQKAKPELLKCKLTPIQNKLIERFSFKEVAFCIIKRIEYTVRKLKQRQNSDLKMVHKHSELAILLLLLQNQQSKIPYNLNVPDKQLYPKIQKNLKAIDASYQY